MKKRTKLKTALFLLAAATNMTYASERTGISYCVPPKEGQTPLEVLECLQSALDKQRQQISELKAENQAQQDEIQALKLKDGLVAHYPFDGNANDVSGHGNHGTVHGATLTTDRVGNPNSAYYFDGRDDYIEIPKGHNLDITGSLTLSAWVHPINYETTASEEKTIVWSQTSYYLSLYRPQKALANYRYGMSNPGYHRTTENSVPIEKYTLITAVWNRESLKQFINGKLVNTIANVQGNAHQTTGVIRIGREDCCGNRAFNGIIDDVRIYNRPLSALEIQALYKQPQLILNRDK
jgi:hypothetical protein